MSSIPLWDCNTQGPRCNCAFSILNSNINTFFKSSIAPKVSLAFEFPSSDRQHRPHDDHLCLLRSSQWRYSRHQCTVSSSRPNLPRTETTPSNAGCRWRVLFGRASIHESSTCSLLQIRLSSAHSPFPEQSFRGPSPDMMLTGRKQTKVKNC